MHLYRILPGVAATLKPNIKLTLVAVIENANGAPPSGSWGAVGGLLVPIGAPPATATDPNTSTGVELSAVVASLAFAF